MDIGAVTPSTAYAGVSHAAAAHVSRNPGSTPTASVQPRSAATYQSTASHAAQTAQTSQGGKAAAEAEASGPHVKFKEADGARVMDVYNSKNVLIYQLPPKGSLTLIHNAESEKDSQVKTSA